jgi:TctA family transporter
MIEAAVAALGHLWSIELWLYMLLGIAGGLIIGIVPGLGGVVGMALYIPFLFGMDPIVGLGMLVGFLAVGATSDSFTCILIGVPGSAGSQATVLDGFALARKGEAARALGASFSASLLGGLFGALALFVVVAAARPFIHSLRSPELFMFTMLGITAVGVLVRGDVLLGLAAAALGVMLATIGGAPAVPEYRFTYGSLYLYDGLSISTVAIGLFAVPEALELLIKRMPISRIEQVKGSLWTGFKETWSHKFLVWRSSLVGTLGGAMPGLGSAATDWIAYAVAKQTVRDSSGFGKGDIRGVIASESANNAKEGGSLIPTLVLGIPGGPTTAMLLGGLVILGINPGPDMLTKHLDLTFTVIWTLVIANAIACIACFALSNHMSLITRVRGELLAPVLIVFFFGAVFQSSQHMGDIIAMLGIGALGYVMRLLGWPRSPFLIGFVLAPGLERYLFLSISVYDFQWLEFTSVRVTAMIIVLALFGPAIAGMVRSAMGAYRRKSSRVSP